MHTRLVPQALPPHTKRGPVALLRLVALATLLGGCGELDTTAKQPDEGQWAVAGYTVPAEWLNDHLEDDDVLVIDARSEEAYDEWHIPGAVNATWQGFADTDVAPGEDGFGVLLDPPALGAALSAAGVREGITVVAYTDPVNGWGEDARVVWGLRMAGFESSKVLNGGSLLWETRGYETSTDAVTPTPGDFTVGSLDPELSVDLGWVEARLDSDTVIFDSREREEYDGAILYGEARGGHIPGAIHLNFRNMLDADGTIESQEEIESILTGFGVSKDDEIVSYCTAGIRSSHLTTVLRMAGYSNATNFDESFYWWAAARELGMPVEDETFPEE